MTCPRIAFSSLDVYAFSAVFFFLPLCQQVTGLGLMSAFVAHSTKGCASSKCTLSSCVLCFTNLACSVFRMCVSVFFSFPTINALVVNFTTKGTSFLESFLQRTFPLCWSSTVHCSHSTDSAFSASCKGLSDA